MLKQNLSQKMLQKLSPQQIQLMKLLQIPTATLDQRIKEELESNPALDEGEDNADVFDLGEENSDDRAEEKEFELDDYLTEYMEDDPSSYKMKGDTSAYNIEETDTPISGGNSFHDLLEMQLGLLEFKTEREEIIANQIIGSIDQDGYLRRETSAIIDDVMFAHGIEIDESEVKVILSMVQRFDPPGIGARDLRECLLIQLNDKIERDTGTHVRAKNLALKILLNHFEEFTKKHYIKLKKNLFVSDGELKEAIDEILKLNPKPASGAATTANRVNQYIVPDFLINNRDGELELTLNSRNAPDLRINDQYMEMLKGYKSTTEKRKAKKTEKEAVMFIKQKIDSAKWFIDAIKQRQDTLKRTMYSIMQYQYDFFKTGDDRTLKPMILKDIAEITGLDISTVSRVANSKFVQTEFGTKRLKDFFSESLMTQDGKEVSTLVVKNILGTIVDQEDKRKPLSDEKLKDMLTEKGYNIARRTIAKYREQLGIPVARLRKEL